jgi:hypothetical protein
MSHWANSTSCLQLEACSLSKTEFLLEHVRLFGALPCQFVSLKAGVNPFKLPKLEEISGSTMLYDDMGTSVHNPSTIVRVELYSILC